MKTEGCCANKAKCIAYTVGILGSLLVVAWLVWLLNQRTAPAALGAERAAERKKAYADIKAAETDALNNYAWQDKGKGFIRLPIERAMEISLQEGKDPKAARANLLARLEKATAAPPKAPEKPSEFE
jgi:hypothetical protein